LFVALPLVPVKQSGPNREAVLKMEGEEEEGWRDIRSEEVTFEEYKVL